MTSKLFFWSTYLCRKRKAIIFYSPPSRIQTFFPNTRDQKRERHRHREGQAKTGPETGVLSHKLRMPWSHQKLEEARKHPPLEPADGYSPPHTWILEPWSPGLKKINVYCFKPLRLWSVFAGTTGS